MSTGRVDAALVAFADAAKADPTRKEPWVRSAQLQFDKSNYARAIVAAEEVLQRDPDDMVADGILTVSGFRIANHSLQRLQGRGALASETARREAETLAGTLKATMGDDILAPEEPQKATAARRPVRRAPAPAAQAPARPAASSASNESGGQSGADPFKNIGGN
ncbi:tetratricopeptide repeat protein [Luteimonas suaedae]|uniref:tetratricopeptide repeat protein n=1 Tax=Luteimonas suaedae TaxID=2605430 RepID=UPI002101D830|nr:tetratricopeptide repeat protein [Luteimonas suaedae]